MDLAAIEASAASAASAVAFASADSVSVTDACSAAASDPASFSFARLKACSAWSTSASNFCASFVNANADSYIFFAAACFSTAVSSSTSAWCSACSLASTEAPPLRLPPVSNPEGFNKSPSTVTQLASTSLWNATARAVAASLHTKALPKT